MVLLFLLIALVMFFLAMVKVPEPAAISWIGAGLFFLTLAFMLPSVKVILS